MAVTARVLNMSLAAIRRFPDEAAPVRASLNAIPDAAIAISANGMFLHANIRGQDLLASRDVLHVLGSRVVPVNDEHAYSFQDFVRNTVALGGAFFSSALPLVLKRGSELHLLHAFVSSDLNVIAGNDEGVVLLIIRSSKAKTMSSIPVLKAFRLTPAEIRLALALEEGLTVHEFASSTSVSEQTVRCQLKSAMAKIGAHRQSELVRLVTRFSQ